jgi:hypothetical protein
VTNTGTTHEQKTSRRGVRYTIPQTLKEKATVSTEAALWKITHNSGKEEISLKVGRYRLDEERRPETDSPKSELTLDHEELDALVKYLGENLEPFRTAARRWIPLDKGLGPAQVEQLKALFANPNKRELAQLLDKHEVLPSDLLRSLEHQRRCRAVGELAQMLQSDLREARWQGWFTKNDWILGSEFVRMLGERAIDVSHIADYLMQAYDGFLDLIEIKRPEGDLRFWADSLDHGNYVPHSDLTKAVTQASRYLLEAEREANSHKFVERLGGVKAVKPRCVLIYGRSNEWNDGQREAYRILNASYHNLSILTFDHVLARARRMLGLVADEAPTGADGDEPFDDDDAPF